MDAVLLRKVRRINALNTTSYEYIQKHGRTNQTLINDTNSLMDQWLTQNLIRDFNRQNIRMTIDYCIKNESEELYHLSLSVRDVDDEIRSFWFYFYDRTSGKIVARVEEFTNTLDEHLYKKDFCFNETIIDALLGAVLTYKIGTTLYWNWEVSNFIPKLVTQGE